MVWVTFMLKGRDVGGSWVLGHQVKAVQMPVAPRIDEKVRNVFDVLVVVNDIEWGLRHDQTWGATAYVEPWDDESEVRSYDKAEAE